MTNFINVRYPLFVFFAFAVGIVTTVLVVYQKYLLACLAFFILLAIAVVCFVTNARAVAVVLLVSCVVGIGVTALTVASIEGRRVHVDYKVQVEGTVCQVSNDESSCCITLKNVTITHLDGSTQKLDGKTYFYNYNKDQVFDLGDKVTCFAKVQNRYVFRNTVETLDYCNGVYYKLVSVDKLICKSGTPTLAERCRQYVLDRLSEVMPTQGNVAYALITGDKSLMDEGSLSAYKNAGVIHVFAVSGLHVGFLVAIIGWVLHRLRVSGWLRLVLTIVPLLFYCYVCNFPPSVVRATVMTAVALLMRIAWHRTDLLNSASVSALILLLINPLYLFDAGFLLSFGAVYGIATVSTALNRAIDQANCHNAVKTVLRALSISLGATAGTVFITAYFFGTVATLGVIANLVVIPLVSVAFTFTVLSLLPWIFGYLGAISELILSFVGWISAGVSSLSFSTVDFGAGLLVAVMLVVLLFVLGDYVNVTPKAKRVVCLVLALALVVTTVAVNLPKKDDGRLFVTLSNDRAVAVASDGEGNYLAVTDLVSLSDLEKICQQLDKYKVKSLDVAVLNYKDVNPNAVANLLDNYNLNKLYVFDKSGNDAVDLLLLNEGVKVVAVPPNSSVGSLDATVVYDGVPIGLRLQCKGFTALIVVTDNPMLLNKINLYNNVDVVFSASYVANLSQKLSDKVVLFGNEGNLGNKNSVTECGNFTIIKKDGKIKVTT